MSPTVEMNTNSIFKEIVLILSNKTATLLVVNTPIAWSRQGKCFLAHLTIEVGKSNSLYLQFTVNMAYKVRLSFITV